MDGLPFLADLGEHVVVTATDHSDIAQPVVLDPALAHRQVAHVSVEHRQRCGCVVEQQIQAFVVLPQGLLQGLAAADVTADAKHARDLALCIVKGPLGHRVDHLATSRLQSFLVGDDAIAGNRCGVSVTQHLRLAGREQLRVIVAEHVAGRLPEYLEHGSARQDVAARQILGEDGIRGVVEQFGDQPPILVASQFQGTLLLQQTADEAEEQPGGDQDEQPALEHAGDLDVGRVLEDEDDQGIGDEYPDRRDHGVDGDDAQRVLHDIPVHSNHSIHGFRAPRGQSAPGPIIALPG